MFNLKLDNIAPSKSNVVEKTSNIEHLPGDVITMAFDSASKGNVGLLNLIGVYNSMVKYGVTEQLKDLVGDEVCALVGEGNFSPEGLRDWFKKRKKKSTNTSSTDTQETMMYYVSNLVESLEDVEFKPIEDDEKIEAMALKDAFKYLKALLEMDSGLYASSQRGGSLTQFANMIDDMDKSKLNFQSLIDKALSGMKKHARLFGLEIKNDTPIIKNPIDYSKLIKSIEFGKSDWSKPSNVTSTLKRLSNNPDAIYRLDEVVKPSGLNKDDWAQGNHLRFFTDSDLKFTDESKFSGIVGLASTIQRKSIYDIIGAAGVFHAQKDKFAAIALSDIENNNDANLFGFLKLHYIWSMGLLVFRPAVSNISSGIKILKKCYKIKKD